MFHHHFCKHLILQAKNNTSLAISSPSKTKIKTWVRFILANLLFSNFDLHQINYETELQNFNSILIAKTTVAQLFV